ncbi:unnamed protein product [Mesocestoides corti]|uniref:EF-hand domain-containing protein n=2 Tax=Mesocestoides corti TaxID=53468 RepID=A0A3P6I5P2_MESCO|nr:unnamed protein product [Mesocestoides corti]
MDAYAQKKKLDPSFADRWLAMFDSEGNGEIDITEFLLGMGLKPEQVLRKVSTSQLEAYKKVQLIAGDASEEMQKEIINILIRVMRLYASSSQQLVEQLKIRLDKRFGPIWQCTMIRGAYTTCNAHVPGTNMCFRFGDLAFILFKSANGEHGASE